MKPFMTIDRHIQESQAKFPTARGRLSRLLLDIAFACKVITRDVRKAGLSDILGRTGDVNVQGEEVQKLDEYANNVLINVLRGNGTVACLGSEEVENAIILSSSPDAEFIVNFDPLDGSSNIDVNATIGTVFSILKKNRTDTPSSEKDLLQPGVHQVAAGYVIYGSSTMFVYATAGEVHGFTYDPAVGEFLLSHPNIRTPEHGYLYAANFVYYDKFSEGVRRYLDSLKHKDPDTGKAYTQRYIGTMVADIHRNLLKGGIFMYPPTNTSPEGKLRLLYEANPMAFIVENAGGIATDGRQRILEVTPETLHQRTALFIGSTHNMERLMGSIARYD